MNIRDFKDGTRHIRERFTIDWEPKTRQFVILYDGALLARIEDVPELPEGFVPRAAAHLFDGLVGRRSALWEEQAIYGAHPGDQEHARYNGARIADAMMKARESAL